MKKAIPIVLLFLAVGCFKRPLNYESVVEVTAIEMKTSTVDAIPKAQTIKVSAKANSGVFNVYVFLQKDKKSVEKEVFAGKVPASVLAHALKQTEVTELKADIPANEEAAVMLSSGDGKKAEVKLKITN